MTIYIFIINSNLNVMMMIKSVITCMPKSLEISVRRQLNIGLFLFSLSGQNIQILVHFDWTDQSP